MNDEDAHDDRNLRPAVGMDGGGGSGGGRRRLAMLAASLAIAPLAAAAAAPAPAAAAEESSPSPSSAPLLSSFGANETEAGCQRACREQLNLKGALEISFLSLMGRLTV